MNLTLHELSIGLSLTRPISSDDMKRGELWMDQHRDELFALAKEALTARESATGTEYDVCADIQKRQELGLKKYGVSVANNPIRLKAWLQHAYEECLDQAIYLKRAMREIEETPSADYNP